METAGENSTSPAISSSSSSPSTLHPQRSLEGWQMKVSPSHGGSWLPQLRLTLFPSPASFPCTVQFYLWGKTKSHEISPSNSLCHASLLTEDTNAPRSLSSAAPSLLTARRARLSASATRVIHACCSRPHGSKGLEQEPWIAQVAQRGGSQRSV